MLSQLLSQWMTRGSRKISHFCWPSKSQPGVIICKGRMKMAVHLWLSWRKHPVLYKQITIFRCEIWGKYIGCLPPSEDLCRLSVPGRTSFAKASRIKARDWWSLHIRTNICFCLTNFRQNKSMERSQNREPQLFPIRVMHLASWCVQGISLPKGK